MHTASNKRDANSIKTGTKAQRDAHGIKQTRCQRHQNWDQCPTRCTRHQTNAMHTASKLGPVPSAMHTASNKRDAHGIKTGTNAQRDAHGIKQTRCTRHQTNAPGHKIRGTNYAHNDAQAKQLVTSDTIQREPRPTLHRHLGQHMTKLHSYLLQNSDTCRMGTWN